MNNNDKSTIQKNAGTVMKMVVVIMMTGREFINGISNIAFSALIRSCDICIYHNQNCTKNKNYNCFNGVAKWLSKEINEDELKSLSIKLSNKIKQEMQK